MDHSSAYRAYTTLWELPHDAPAFDVDAAGNPIVEQRELLCGFGGPLNGNCGKKFLAKQKLKRHLQKDHDVHPVDRYQVQDRPTSDKMAHIFYITLMKNVAYPDKRTLEEEIASQRLWRKNKLYLLYDTSKDSGQSGEGDIGPENISGRVHNDGCDPVRPRPTRRRRVIHSPGPDDQDDEEAAFSRDGRTDSDGFVADETLSVTSAYTSAGGMPKRQRRNESPHGQTVVRAEQHVIIMTDDDEPETEASTIPVQNNNPTNKESVTLAEDDVEAPSGGEGSFDIENMEFEVKKAQIKRAQLQAELEEVEVKQKMAAMKKRKAGN